MRSRQWMAGELGDLGRSDVGCVGDAPRQDSARGGVFVFVFICGTRSEASCAFSMTGELGDLGRSDVGCGALLPRGVFTIRRGF